MMLKWAVIVLRWLRCLSEYAYLLCLWGILWHRLRCMLLVLRSLLWRIALLWLLLELLLRLSLRLGTQKFKYLTANFRVTLRHALLVLILSSVRLAFDIHSVALVQVLLGNTCLGTAN